MLLRNDIQLMGMGKGNVDKDYKGSFYVNDVNKKGRNFPYKETKFKGAEITIKLSDKEFKLFDTETKILTNLGFLTAREVLEKFNGGTELHLITYEVARTIFGTTYLKMFERKVRGILEEDIDVACIETSLKECIVDGLYLKGA